MLDPKFLRAHRDKVEAGVALKGQPVDLAAFYAVEEQRLKLLHETEELKARRNAASEEIARKKKAGVNADDEIAAMRVVGERIKGLDAELKTLEEKSEALAAWIPNLPHPSTPPGRDATHNQVVRTARPPRTFDFAPQPHWELATRLGLLDFERAPKIAGAGFLLFTGRGARLERALINFMLDFHTTRHGYTEVSPPHVVRRASLFGTGQLPKLEADMYLVGEDELFLNPTAEVPVTNIHRDEILEPGRVPMNLTAYCASYRREAGAYGKDTRGMVRVHQFDKVELVKIALPETSYDAHEKLAAEVPVTNLHRDEILEPGMVPRYLTAYCASYRREAGAYGKDTRGMTRVHQFDKVELVKIVPPEPSGDEHERLARDVSDIFEALELPWRQVLLCSGDLSFAAAKCYDFEVWSPGTNAWLECSSCSNFEDFQARRMNMRFRREPGAKVEYPHTLNASGLALPRTYATLLENHQTASGAVRIPAALRPYLDGLEEIAPPA